MNEKIHIALLFGGQSAEHEVSVRSAQNIYNALDKEKYDVTLIGITKDGSWQYLPSISLPEHSTPKKPEEAGLVEVFSPFSRISVNQKPIDVVFPVLHGPNGEDGSIQGMLQMIDIPFVGPNVLGSAIGMDKDIMKRLLRDAGIPIGKFSTLTDGKQMTFSDAEKAVGLPLFVKPANLGSSVGVSKVTSEDEYNKALETAFLYDRKILIEEAIIGRELEISVLGNEDPIASIAGEIIPKTHDFYDYDAKYINSDAVELRIPAHLPDATLKELQDLAIRVFTTLSCEGMARVDFFMTPHNKLFVNEINTIPGFTNISMYPSLWKASGISYPALIDKLIDLAIERHTRDTKYRRVTK